MNAFLLFCNCKIVVGANVGANAKTLGTKYIIKITVSISGWFTPTTGWVCQAMRQSIVKHKLDFVWSFIPCTHPFFSDIGVFIF